MSARANRVGWAVASVLLMGIGAAGLALTQGAFGSRPQHTAIVSHTLARQWNEGGNTSFGVAGAIGAVVAVAGLALAFAQLRRPRSARRSRLGDLRYPSPRGQTTVRVHGLRRAFEAEMRSIDGVGHAAIALVDREPGIEVASLIEVERGVELTTVAQGVAGAVGRLGHTSGRPVAGTGVMVRLLTTPAPRSTGVQ